MLLTCTGSAGLSGNGSGTATHQLVRALKHWWPAWNKSTVVKVFIQKLRAEALLEMYLERNWSLGSGHGQITPASAEAISSATKNAKLTYSKTRSTRRMSRRVLGESEVNGTGKQEHTLLVWSGCEGHKYSASILHYQLEAQVRNTRGFLLCAYFNCSPLCIQDWQG